MASVTLVESAKLTTNMLLAGVIQNIYTINQFYQVLPFKGIEGNALQYTRENALGDSQFATVGDTITAKAAGTFTSVTAPLTTLLGDAEVNGMIQATRSDRISQKAVQIASKAKSISRQYQQTMITGDGTSNTFQGLISLATDSGQAASTGTNGGALSFTIMDDMLSRVVDKDGQVDYIIMNVRTINSYKALVRSLGGITADDVYTLPTGKTIIAYGGVPIFRNDYIPITQTKGSGSAQTTIFAGTLDDGSEKVGISGLTASQAAGLVIEDVGIHQSRDETITRVKWYCGFALFNTKGLAWADGITN